jgi:pimeloyl-ACP methyl ester carboxylesterase
MSANHGVAGAESLRLQVNGIELHVVAAGPPDGPLVILLHGFPEFWWGWRRQIAPLAAAGLRVIVPDQRGYNLSSKPEGVAAYAVDTLADDVLALGTALGRDRFAVAGHDWGAILGWHLAARNPERIERVAILNGPQLATLRDHMARHPWQLPRIGYFALFQLPLIPEAGLRAANFAALATGLRTTSRSGTFPEEALLPYREAWSRPGALTAMLNWYRAAARHPPPLRRDRITVPVRVIWGNRDIALDRRLAEAGAALCDRAEVIHLPDATHWLQHEMAEEVNAHLVGFLARSS